MRYEEPILGSSKTGIGDGMRVVALSVDPHARAGAPGRSAPSHGGRSKPTRPLACLKVSQPPEQWSMPVDQDVLGGLLLGLVGGRFVGAFDEFAVVS